MTGGRILCRGFECRLHVCRPRASAHLAAESWKRRLARGRLLATSRVFVAGIWQDNVLFEVYVSGCANRRQNYRDGVQATCILQVQVWTDPLDALFRRHRWTSGREALAIEYKCSVSTPREVVRCESSARPQKPCEGMWPVRFGSAAHSQGCPAMTCSNSSTTPPAGLETVVWAKVYLLKII